MDPEVSWRVEKWDENPRKIYSKCGIKLSNSSILLLTMLKSWPQRLRNVLKKMLRWIILALSLGILKHGLFLRHPAMIRSVPLSSSRHGSGTHVLIKWVLTHHYLVTHFSLTEHFSCFVQLEGRSSQKASHYKRDMTGKIINSTLLYKF